MLQHFSVATFKDRLGETFRLLPDSGEPLDLVLVEARGLAKHSNTREPFSVVFRAPATPVLAQMIRRLEHPELGAFELFLVPIGPDDVGMRYEAVFT
jgi:hypothetical protein